MIKRPRIKNEAHLKFIRGLPCVVCGDNTSTEAAHIRMSCDWAGKRAVGMGEKPDDIWTVPLCGRCHKEQHGMNEQDYWWGVRMRYLDPVKVALALFVHTGQHEVGEQIVRAQ